VAPCENVKFLFEAVRGRNSFAYGIVSIPRNSPGPDGSRISESGALPGNSRTALSDIALMGHRHLLDGIARGERLQAVGDMRWPAATDSDGQGDAWVGAGGTLNDL